MRSVVLVVLVATATARADEPSMHVVATALTVQRDADASAKLVVSSSKARMIKNTMPCTVGVTLVAKHAELKRLQLDFRLPNARPEELQVRVTGSQHTASAKGRVKRISASSSGIRFGVESRVRVDGVTWSVKGSIDFSDVDCAWD